MSTPFDDSHPQDLIELITFFGRIGKAGAAAYGDDHKIGFFEALGMLAYLKDLKVAIEGADTIPAELDQLTPAGAELVGDAIAGVFPGLLKPRQDAIARAALACVPAFVRLVQVIRSTSAEAMDERQALPISQ